MEWSAPGRVARVLSLAAGRGPPYCPQVAAQPGGRCTGDLDRAMERNLFKYIWRHSWRDQVYILVIVAMLQVFYFISLDLPKRIVNDGIRGDAFKNGAVRLDTLPF